MQLNPGGVLNHKYAAELAVRDTGLPYVVMRSTGRSRQAAAVCVDVCMAVEPDSARL